jgi:hypothetical protein
LRQGGPWHRLHRRDLCDRPPGQGIGSASGSDRKAPPRDQRLVPPRVCCVRQVGLPVAPDPLPLRGPGGRRESSRRSHRSSRGDPKFRAYQAGSGRIRRASWLRRSVAPRRGLWGPQRGLHQWWSSPRTAVRSLMSSGRRLGRPRE